MKSEKMAEEEMRKKEMKEEDEEEKMKNFYRLVENIRETRKLWQTAQRKRQRRETQLWKPAFEWEDFSHGSSSDRDDGIVSSEKETLEEGTDSSTLDLSLGL